MRIRRAQGETERLFASLLPAAIRQTRLQLGWPQTVLASRSGMSQPQVSRLERGRIDAVSIMDATRVLDALGIRASVTLDQPLIARVDRQRDAAHARCVGFGAGRLEGMRWEIRSEVEVHHGRSHGWIDLMGFHRPTGSVIVVEIKTHIPDVGAVQRTLGWYTRMAWGVGRGFGWRIARVGAALLVLATEANDRRLAENGPLVRRAFPVRASELAAWLAAPVSDLPGPALALIDPRSRRTRWLIPTTADGRRSPLRYADSTEFLRGGR